MPLLPDPFVPNDSIVRDTSPPRGEENGGGVPVFSIADGELLLVLEGISQEAINDIIEKKPKKVIALDRLFAGNDQLKTNTALQMKDEGIEFKTI